MGRQLTIALRACSALALLALTAPAAGAQDALAQVTTSPDGKFLADAEGMSLYLFEADTENTSTCYDDCAAAWPPLLVWLEV